MLDRKVDMLSKLPDDVLLKIFEQLDITDVARTSCQIVLGKSSHDMLDKEVVRLSKLPDDVLLKIVERLDIIDVARTGCQIGLGKSSSHMLDNEVHNDVLLKIVERLPNDVLLKIVERLDITDVERTGCWIGLGKSFVDMLGNEVDRLSNLPDDVLLNIVERLDINDVARTAVLSKRWKQIPAMLSKIIITVGSLEPKHGRRKLTSHDIERANTTVLEATRSILERRTGSLYTIHLMSMQFYLGEESILIGQSVANTMATQKVALVEFTILTELGINCTSEDLLTYGKQFMLFFDSCPNVFAGLAHLSLQNLRLGESHFPKIFGICKQLEILYLHQCDMGHLSLLDVEHPQLHELVISCSSLERVDLKWVPKLTVVEFNGFISPDDPFSLGYVPLLETVSIINTGLSWHKMLKLSELLGKTAVSNLHLNFKSEKIWVKPEGRKQLLPVFHKLSLVNLFNISEECDLTWTMFILHGAPTLKKLCIMVRDHLCEMIKGKRRYLYAFSEEKDKGLESEPFAPDFKHRNLAELRIHGFQAEDKFVRYARNVMEAAVNLEAVYLHKNPGCEKCKPILASDWTCTEKLLIRDKINKGTWSRVGIHFPSRGQEYS